MKVGSLGESVCFVLTPLEPWLKRKLDDCAELCFAQDEEQRLCRNCWQEAGWEWALALFVRCAGSEV